jgi:hypothetical protein
MSFKKLLILSSAALIISSSAFGIETKGTETSGGGDARCYEYTNLVGEIVKTLVTTGQEKIDQVDSVIRVSELLKIKSALRCIPVDQLDRQARSYPEEVYTDLLVKDWEKLNSLDKINLASHELAVLAKYENDGEYYISEDIVKIVASNSKKLRDQMNAEQVTYKADGTATFQNPFIRINNENRLFGAEKQRDHEYYFFVISYGDFKQYTQDINATAKSLCLYLGYKESISFNLVGSKNDTYASLDLEGNFNGIKSKRKSDVHTIAVVSTIFTSSVDFFQTISCK